MPAMSVHLRKDWGWYATFALLLIVAFITIYYLTGRNALGASARFLWNGLVVVANGLIRLIGSSLGVLARGFGWRRLSRWSAVIAGVGLGYAGSVVLSETRFTRPLAGAASCMPPSLLRKASGATSLSP